MWLLCRVSTASLSRYLESDSKRSMGAMLYGYDLGVISYVLVAPDFLKTMDTTDENYIGFITSSMLLGAFVGSIPASLIADAFSRRMASKYLTCKTSDIVLTSTI